MENDYFVLDMQSTNIDNAYNPVAHEYREMIEEQIAKGAAGKIFFWSDEKKIDEVFGKAMKLEEFPGQGIFAILEADVKVRIDRIITFFGKPGPAYEEYDSFSNQCLSCTAGVPI